LNDGTIKIGTELDQTGMKKGLDGLGGYAQKGFGVIGKAAQVMGGVAVGAIAAVGTSMGAAVVAGFNYNKQMENYMASFTTMLGDEATALAKVEELKKLAAATPYEMGDLAKATTTLLAFGIANEKSTEDLTMLGDISLGSVDKLDRLTIAFGKASSQGKLTGESVQMMIEAGFNPLKVISETTGETMLELTDRMSKGGISADEMTAAFKKATSEGGQFYKGMEIASKTTDGMISTLKDNANAFLGQVMEPISAAIKDKLIPTALTAIDKLTKAFTKDGVPGLIKAVKEIAPVLSPVIDLFTWIIENAETLAKVIGVVTGAMLAYNTVLLIQNTALEISNALAVISALKTGGMAAAKLVLTGIIGAETAATTGATAAQWLLNLAMDANPAGLLIGLIAALGTALVLFGGHTDVATQATQKLLDESKNLITSCKDSAEAFAEQSGEADINAAVTQKLSDKLFALSDKQRKTNAEKKEMTSLVSQLNGLMPDLNLTIDKQTGLLSENKDAVDRLIKSKLAEIKLQANEDRLLGIYKEELELTDAMTAAQKSLTDAKAKDEKNKHMYSDDWDAIMNAKKAVDLLTTSLSENAAMAKTQEDAIGQSGAATIPYTDSILKTGKVVIDTNKDMVASVTLTAEETKAKLKEQEDATKKYYDDLQKSFENHLSEMGSLETLGIERSKLTAAELKKNRDQQVKDYQDWRAGLKVIAEQVPGDVLAELEKLGPTYDQIIDDLAKMTPEQVAAWVESWRAPAKEAAQAAIEEMGKAPGAAYEAGKSTGFEFDRGLRLGIAATKLPDIHVKVVLDSNGKISTPLSTTGYLNIPKFAEGTKYLPRDMVILAHKGEAIIPEAQNPYANPISQMQGQAYSRSVPSESTALRSMSSGSSGASDTLKKGPEVIIIPVSVGGNQIEEIVVKAADNYAIKKNR